jgi:peroxiredoxin
MTTRPQPGMPAPLFTLPDAEKNPVQLADYRGKNVVLAFYPADWSDVCTSQLAIMQQHLDRIRSYDADVLAISVDSHESHRAWAQYQGLTFPLLSDFWPHGAVAERYGVLRPADGISERALFFIDRDGLIQDVWIGEHPGVQPPIDVVIAALERIGDGSAGRQA